MAKTKFSSLETVADLKDVKTLLEEKIVSLDNEVKKYVASEKVKDSLIKNLTVKFDEFEEQSKSMKEKIEDLNDDLEIKDEEIVLLKAQVADCSQHLSVMKSDLDASNKRGKELKADLQKSLEKENDFRERFSVSFYLFQMSSMTRLFFLENKIAS